MRSSWLLPFLFLPACVSEAAYIVATADDTALDLDVVADDLVTADVVALGELHQTPPVHRLHHELLAAMHARRPNLVIAMEMFERDAQTVLLQYLDGMVDEATFLRESRPWPDYARDYRPVIEFAKANGIVVLAANAPRRLANQVAREGAAAVAGNAHVARETTAPEDDYWDSFREMMKEHPGVAEKQMKSFYAAQCLKDDTMAESITDYLQQRRQEDDRPLVVLVCGRAHSDHGRGTVARIKSRMPDLVVRVLTAETVKNVSSGLYASPKGAGDYVVVSPEVARQVPQVGPVLDTVAKAEQAPATEAAPKVAAKVDTGQGAAPVAPAKPATPVAEQPANPEGLRPALGLMPDYGASDAGVTVGSLREGGPAETAGVEAGDVIVMLAGVKVADVESYMAVLEAQTIGKTVTVRVRRGNAEVDLQVKVGSRSR